MTPLLTPLTFQGAPLLNVYSGAGVPMAPKALQQATRASRLPGVVTALGMPDMHPGGSGLPNGFVLATEGVIYPAAVGGDINCGMRLLTTDVPRSAFQGAIRPFLEDMADAVNLGKRWNHVRVTEEELGDILTRGVAALADISPATRSGHPAWEIITRDYLADEQRRIEHEGSLPGNVAAVPRRVFHNGEVQLGTLGEGNHFFEIQTVANLLFPEKAAALGIEKGTVVFMIHTGSRGLGHQLGAHFINRAKNLGGGRQTPIGGVYPLRMDSEEGIRYVGGMNAAANYAYVNRLILGALAAQILHRRFPGAAMRLLYDVSHNMATWEEHRGERLLVHRKGATRAFPPEQMAGTPFAETGQPVLIPGSMGTSSFLLAGIGTSTASLDSVNHGAGRLMSRSAALGVKTTVETWEEGARERRARGISKKEFRRAMRGVEMVYADGKTIVAEAPQAYKPIERVMTAVLDAGLAEGVAELKPIGVIKE